MPRPWSSDGIAGRSTRRVTQTVNCAPGASRGVIGGGVAAGAGRDETHLRVVGQPLVVQREPYRRAHPGRGLGRAVAGGERAPGVAGGLGDRELRALHGRDRGHE